MPYGVEDGEGDGLALAVGEGLALAFDVGAGVFAVDPFLVPVVIETSFPESVPFFALTSLYVLCSF